uniref:Uncharacterized protein n=1 Tax=Romanomermis culicivorax TaxID=13658 RepID=A0A915KQZ3_ROMCU
MDICVREKIGAHDTLIVSIIIEDYTLDHVFAECRFHCNDYCAMRVNNSAIGEFNFSANRQCGALGTGVDERLCLEGSEFDGYLGGSCGGLFPDESL